MTAQRGRRPVTDFQSEKFMDRRGFLKELGLVGGSGVLLAMFPWLQSCSDEARREVAGEKARLAIVGTGSRGHHRFFRSFFFVHNISTRNYSYINNLPYKMRVCKHVFFGEKYFWEFFSFFYQ